MGTGDFRRQYPPVETKLESFTFPLPKKQNPQLPLRALHSSGRQDCLRYARRSFSPPFYTKSPIPTPSRSFCFVVRFCEQVRTAPEQNKTRSYRCGLLVSRDDKIRTCDPLHPMQVRYRAALRPEKSIRWGAKVRKKTTRPFHF